MVRPRYEEASTEAYDMLTKAHSLADRLDTLEKAKMCPCGSGKPQAKCCPDMKKGDHHYTTTFSTEPAGVEFHAESGGQTRNAFYTTNQSLLDVADIANKGATSESVNLETLPVNTHDVVNRLIEG
tara:strand:+ start:907 stop:1284 length:378 start_codon:yes stop_codon:yes gene_type:complete